MTQKRFLIIGMVLVLLISGFSSFLALGALNKVSADQRKLAAIQTNALVSQKASAETRISTVEQRCDLTKELIAILQPRYPKTVMPLHTSLTRCENQLTQVKLIAARTP